MSSSIPTNIEAKLGVIASPAPEPPVSKVPKCNTVGDQEHSQDSIVLHDAPSSPTATSDRGEVTRLDSVAPNISDRLPGANNSFNASMLTAEDISIVISSDAQGTVDWISTNRDHSVDNEKSEFAPELLPTSSLDTQHEQVGTHFERTEATVASSESSAEELDQDAAAPEPIYDSRPEPASVESIIKHGKTASGNLTREARSSLSKLGLRSIPSMHGPTTLPYARCPSGIDAFIFSMDKDEDPYTFLLEADRVKKYPGIPSRHVPLPGNSRYTHLGQMHHGSRVASAPAAFRGQQEPRLPVPLVSQDNHARRQKPSMHATKRGPRTDEQHQHNRVTSKSASAGAPQPTSHLQPRQDLPMPSNVQNATGQATSFNQPPFEDAHNGFTAPPLPLFWPPFVSPLVNPFAYSCDPSAASIGGLHTMPSYPHVQPHANADAGHPAAPTQSHLPLFQVTPLSEAGQPLGAADAFDSLRGATMGLNDMNLYDSTLFGQQSQLLSQGIATAHPNFVATENSAELAYYPYGGNLLPGGGYFAHANGTADPAAVLARQHAPRHTVHPEAKVPTSQKVPILQAPPRSRKPSGGAKSHSNPRSKASEVVTFEALFPSAKSVPNTPQGLLMPFSPTTLENLVPNPARLGKPLASSQLLSPRHAEQPQIIIQSDEEVRHEVLLNTGSLGTTRFGRHQRTPSNTSSKTVGVPQHAVSVAAHARHASLTGANLDWRERMQAAEDGLAVGLAGRSARDTAKVIREPGQKSRGRTSVRQGTNRGSIAAASYAS